MDPDSEYPPPELDLRGPYRVTPPHGRGGRAKQESDNVAALRAGLIMLSICTCFFASPLWIAFELYVWNAQRKVNGQTR